MRFRWRRRDARVIVWSGRHELLNLRVRHGQTERFRLDPMIVAYGAPPLIVEVDNGPELGFWARVIDDPARSLDVTP